MHYDLFAENEKNVKLVVKEKRNVYVLLLLDTAVFPK